MCRFEKIKIFSRDKQSFIFDMVVGMYSKVFDAKKLFLKTRWLIKRVSQTSLDRFRVFLYNGHIHQCNLTVSKITGREACNKNFEFFYLFPSINSIGIP